MNTPRKSVHTTQEFPPSLRASIVEGSFYTMMVGFGEAFFGAYIIALRASHFVIGLIGSLPQTMGSLAQIFSIQLVRLFKSRKQMVARLVLAQAFLYLPITVGMILPRTTGIWLIGISITLYFIIGIAVVPAWIEWMGFLVPEDLRGRYYGLRNSVAGFFSLASFLVAGFFLQLMDQSGLVWVGYAILFGLAFLSRVCSFFFLLKVEDSQATLPPPLFTGFSTTKIKHHITKTPFFGFLAHSILMNLAVYISAPYFAVYMLQELNFSYWTFTYILAIPIFVRAITMPVWGKICDLYGNRSVLAFSATFLGALPILWLVSPHVWFIAIIQVLSGFLWAAYELSSFNTFYDLTPEKSRMKYNIILNVINSLAFISGALAGSRIISFILWLNNEISPYHGVFLVSGLSRFITAFYWLPRIPHAQGKQSVPFRHILWTFSIFSIRELNWASLQVKKRVKRKKPMDDNP